MQIYKEISNDCNFPVFFFICPLVSLPDNDRTWIFRGVKHEDIVADTVFHTRHRHRNLGYALFRNNLTDEHFFVVHLHRHFLGVVLVLRLGEGYNGVAAILLDGGFLVVLSQAKIYICLTFRWCLGGLGDGQCVLIFLTFF